MIERIIPLSFELYHALRTLYDEQVQDQEELTTESYGLRLAKVALDKASHYETFLQH